MKLKYILGGFFTLLCMIVFLLEAVPKPEVQEWVIDFKDADENVTPKDIAAFIQLNKSNEISFYQSGPYAEKENIFIVKTTRAYVSYLLNSHWSRYIEGIEKRRTYYAYTSPNDPLYPKQWNMKEINLEQAWEKSNHGEGAIVAVIDTGVAYRDHKNLAKGIPDLKQTEFVESKTFCSGLPDGLDDQGHGSHVAGTIAQSTNNELGVVGIAPKAKIMSLKVLTSRGSGTNDHIANAIMYAADHGATVINMSLGGPFPSDIMEKAMKYAYDKGVTIVCAAGNENSKSLGYPASYDECLAVAAHGPNYEKAFYSNWGSGIDIAAPGGDKSQSPENGILQATINGNAMKNDFLYYQGTSMAAPHVAGVAALINGAGVTDPAKVKEILLNSSVQPPNYNEDYHGNGVLNADKAVQMVNDEYKSGNTPWWKNRWFILALCTALLVAGIFVYEYFQKE